MALKTDYYSGHGTNMHAAYNVQALVSSGIITLYGVFQDRADYYTLKSMLEKYHKYCGKYPKNIFHDSERRNKRQILERTRRFTAGKI